MSGAQPVANARVWIVRRKNIDEPATTAADGSFTLKTGGLMLFEADLAASADGERLMGLAKHVEPRRAGASEPVRIVLKPSRVMKVQVRDAKGQPIPGASVAAVGYDYDASAKTAAGGEAELGCRPMRKCHGWWGTSRGRV